ETHTTLPVIQTFQARHQVADMLVVADAGMFSDGNLTENDAAKLRFIGGCRQTRAPKDLAQHFHSHPGVERGDGIIVDTVTTRARFKPAPDHLPSVARWSGILTMPTMSDGTGGPCGNIAPNAQSATWPR